MDEGREAASVWRISPDPSILNNSIWQEAGNEQNSFYGFWQVGEGNMMETKLLDFSFWAGLSETNIVDTFFFFLSLGKTVGDVLFV